jgi:predicted RNA-binding Zn-ribbon protein involved in translation (DUF1610 family)
MRLRLTKGAQNRCDDCGYTWHPRERNFSNKCPQCGGENVSYDTRGWAIFAALISVVLIILFFGRCSPIASRNSKPNLVDMSQVGRATPTPSSVESHPILPPPPSIPVPPPSPPLPVAPGRTEFEKYMSVEESQREAVRRYPELGTANSAFNTEFIRRHRLYQESKPEFFDNPTWPLRLAEEVATSRGE